ncbi:MAG: type II toxin-antitoxin system RelE/ParE family toxin [Desulfobulbaceae bacterium]|nr:type II toxin-antitoxin system RelE/ParE family toxin [Desulfobulbaceae bacterium]
MRIFKTKWFSRFASKETIDDTKLLETVHTIESGLVDADYGSDLIKQRIARDGGGKSGGYRSAIAFRSENRCVFLFAFQKSDQENLTAVEKREYKKAANIYLGMTEKQIEKSIESGALIEVEYVQKIQK